MVDTNSRSGNSNSDTNHADPSAHWHRVRLLTFALLIIWVLVNVGVIFFARELASLTVGGWPISFYMAAQGTTLIYLLIIGIYAFAMSKLEHLEKGSADEAE